ncbi:MAG TPA: hypothetical protein VNJ07_02760, partial [Chitinophagales bacterium]|nr:hypothetical protein [Chitinophagales bacterium]
MLILVFTSLILSFCLAGCSQQAEYHVGLIGFYNLENLFDTVNQEDVGDEEFTAEGAKHYTDRVYRDKLSRLSQVISEMGTDDSPDGVAMLGVAEVENRTVLEDLVKTPNLTKRNYQIVHIDGKDERGVDVGLLYNPNYFKVTRAMSLPVPTEKIDTAYGHTRDVLYIWGEFLGEAVHIFVNHWPSRRGGEEASRPFRELAASVCKLKVDSLTHLDPNAKIIVMGDLNDDPADASVTKVLGATGKKEDVKSGGLYNPWWALYKKGIGTL